MLKKRVETTENYLSFNRPTPHEVTGCLDSVHPEMAIFHNFFVRQSAADRLPLRGVGPAGRRLELAIPIYRDWMDTNYSNAGF